MNFMLINLLIWELIFARNAINLGFYKLIFKDPVNVFNIRIFSKTARTHISIFPHRFFQTLRTHMIVTFAFSALFWLSQKIFANSTLNLWKNIGQSFEIGDSCFRKVEISSIFSSTTVHLIASMIFSKLSSVALNPTVVTIKRIFLTIINLMR